MRSQLNLSVDPEHLSPGGNCTITIETAPNSVVSLSVIENRNFIGFEDFNKHLSGISQSSSIEGKNIFVVSDFKRNEENCPATRVARSAEDEDDENDEDIFKMFSNDDIWKNENIEPWIFESFKADEDGKIILNRKVPNVVTSWYFSAVSTHLESGFASTQLTKIHVSKNFFIKVNFPFSIRIQEILRVEVIVFNYVPGQTNASEVEIKFTGNEEGEEFEFIEVNSECNTISMLGSENVQNITVQPNSQLSVTIFIRPIKSGSLKFKIKAFTDSGLTDELDKILKVLPDISTTFQTTTLFADLRNTSRFSYGISINQMIPNDAIWNSIRIEGSAGNLLDALVQDAKSMLAR